MSSMSTTKNKCMSLNIDLYFFSSMTAHINLSEMLFFKDKKILLDITGESPTFSGLAGQNMKLLNLGSCLLLNRK